MGADTKKLRTRIKSVQSTLHTTKAMGLVASSKIKKATESMHKGREYAKALSLMVEQLSQSAECAKSPYMQKREAERVKLIVIAGDRGLAGGYNANIFRFVRQFSDVIYIPIGKRAHDRFGGTFYSAEHFSYKEAIELSKTLCNEFAEGAYDALGIVSTKYVSMMAQEPTLTWVLPLEKKEGTASCSAVFEPDELTVLNAAIPEYVAGILTHCVKESFASEVAARRMAMDSAGKNAQMMIDDLSLAYNRARQGAITQEITEIIAGSGE
ncbi:MAG: ATP synthase F1 subunit gamma [Ruminococcaceae bacterium]|nr:ATP synthase F1 subunit gamma [Oscillospiraceae bacterium]